MYRKIFLVVLLTPYFVTGLCALNITFKAFKSGKIASPELQSWIVEAIEKERAKGLSGSDLCENVSDYMGDNHGKYWHCFVKSEHFNFWSENGDRGAYFDLDGVNWVVFKGRQVNPSQEVKKIQADKEKLNDKIRNQDKKISEMGRENKSLKDKLSSTEKELSTAKSDLEQKQKEHNEYIKKMDATKAILQKLLQRSRSLFL